MFSGARCYAHFLGWAWYGQRSKTQFSPSYTFYTVLSKTGSFHKAGKEPRTASIYTLFGHISKETHTDKHGNTNW